MEDLQLVPHAAKLGLLAWMVGKAKTNIRERMCRSGSCSCSDFVIDVTDKVCRYISSLQDRIRWLEESIKQNCPEFNLNKGPRVLHENDFTRCWLRHTCSLGISDKQHQRATQFHFKAVTSSTQTQSKSISHQIPTILSPKGWLMRLALSQSQLGRTSDMSGRPVAILSRSSFLLALVDGEKREYVVI